MFLILLHRARLGRALYPLAISVFERACVFITLFSLRQPPRSGRLCSLSAWPQEAFVGESKKQKLMRHIVLSVFSTRVAHARLYTKDFGRQFPVRVSGVILGKRQKGLQSKKKRGDPKIAPLV